MIASLRNATRFAFGYAGFNSHDMADALERHTHTGPMLICRKGVAAIAITDHESWILDEAWRDPQVLPAKDLIEDGFTNTDGSHIPQRNRVVLAIACM